MPEWFSRAFEHSPDASGASLNEMIVRMVAAFLLGCGVAAVYRFTHRRDAEYSPTFVTTLVLLAVLIAVATQVIGNNGARAFTLLGALAIVRFRTIMRDTRDTAFVIFAVIMGMAAGGGHLQVALAGFGVATAAAAVFRPRAVAAATASWELKVRVGVGAGGHSPTALLKDLFDRHLSAVEQSAVATGRQGAAVDLTYRVRLRPSADPAIIVADLNRLEGVESVVLNQPQSVA
jgi:hypothetical protein